MTEDSAPVAIVMAAGKSTRMKSELPKVLHDLCGQPLLSYVLSALREAGIHRILVVVGFGADLVRERFAHDAGLEFVLQEKQRGTGDAVGACAGALREHRGSVVVLAGDGPMIRPELIQAMMARFAAAKAKALLATALVNDPTGFGRIVRDGEGRFQRIVEQKDASSVETAIREVNPSFYVFDGPALFRALQRVEPNNAQGEYYITDVPGILRADGEVVVAEVLASEADMFGVNDRRHLATAHALMQNRIQQNLMLAGVSIVDPRNTYIDARARIGVETVIYPFSVIQGPCQLGAGCRVGPFALVRADAVLPDGGIVQPFTQYP